MSYLKIEISNISAGIWYLHLQGIIRNLQSYGAQNLSKTTIYTYYTTARCE